MTSAPYLLWLIVAVLLSACSMSSAVPSETPTQADIVPVSSEPSDTPAPTNTPFVMPTAPPPPTPMCEDAPRTRLTSGERGRVLDNDPRPVNIRSLPGVNTRIVAAIPPDAIFFVIEGPRCEEDYAWYYVRYQRTEGWIAEGDPTSYYVEPYPPAG